MEQRGNLYIAEEGKLIVRKADDFIMGDAIDLGSADSINNYEERDFTKEEIDAFYESVGMENPKKRNVVEKGYQNEGVEVEETTSESEGGQTITV